MSALILPHRLRVQPQQGVPMDRGALAASHVAFFNPAAQVNAADGRTVTIYGTPQVVADPVFGRALLLDGANDSWNSAGSYAGTGRDITLWCFLRLSSLASARNLLGTSSSLNAGVTLGYTLSGKLTFTKGNVIDIPSPFSPVAGDPYFFGVSYTHATGLVTFYLRHMVTGDVSTATATNATAWRAGDGVFAYGGRQSSPTSTWSGTIGAGGVAHRALTIGELSSIASNPWQLLKAPARRLWYAGIAASVVSGTFSSTTQGASLVASGAVRATGALSSALTGASLSASGVAGSTPSGVFASTLAGAAFAASGAGTNAGSFASSLSGATLSLAGAVRNDGAFASSLAGASLNAAGSATQNAAGTFASTLSGASLSAGGYVGVPPEVAGFFLRLPKNPRHILPLH